jgi:hypothetical protein
MAPVKRKRVWNFSLNVELDQGNELVQRKIFDRVRCCAQRERNACFSGICQEATVTKHRKPSVFFKKDLYQLDCFHFVLLVYASGIWQIMRHFPPESEEERLNRLKTIHSAIVKISELQDNYFL